MPSKPHARSATAAAAPATAIALTILLLTSGLVMADNIKNDVAANTGAVDVALNQAGRVGFEVQSTGGDGQQGCNAADSTPLTLSFNMPSHISASPSTLTYDACGVRKYAWFTSSEVGTHRITVSWSDSGVGSYDTSFATFSLRVAAPNTAPVLTLPGNLAAEATSAAGAVVQYQVSASDADGDAVTIACTSSPTAGLASGSTFPLGVTQIACTATDTKGAATSGSFTVTVADTSMPTLSLPPDMTVEATGPSGAAVTYPASATDAVDGPLAASCAPASGSVFAIATTPVACSATDGAGNVATGGFSVTVVDTTPPELEVPDAIGILSGGADIVEEATGPGGAAVTFSVSAYDLVDGDVDVTCDAQSGDVFPLGLSTVTCGASDTRGNADERSFTIQVVDTTPPTLPALPDLVLRATSAQGAVASWPAATDLVDGSVALSCSVPSGATLPLGTTSVTCTAVDAAGNQAPSKTFLVSVRVGWSNLLQPVNLDGSSVFKLGSTVPLKFRLLDESAGVTNLVAKVYVSRISGNVMGTELEGVSTSSADSGNTFRYDPTSGQYIYNLGTKSLSTGTWQVRVDLGDGTWNTVRISLR